jgi:TonB family protein
MDALPLVLAALAAQAQPFATVPPAPPPVLNAITYAPPAPAIVRFRPGPATCRGEEQRPTLAEEPFPLGVMRAPSAGSSVALHFRIDPSGRPLGISHPPSPIPGFGVGDVAAAFAAWRFEPGAERRDCAIVFTPAAETVAAAAPESLHRFLALHPQSGQPRMIEVGRPAFDRVRPAGSTCFGGPRNVRLQAYPAFDEIKQPLGTLSYSFLAFDVARDGRPRNVRLLGSSGNRELDRQSLAALSRSRYQPEAKVGCLYHFYRRQAEPTPPPPIAEVSAFRAEGASCPQNTPDWVHMPPLRFPQEFQRRAIEGWAIVSYDLAPWGQTGNVKVLAAEPAAAFGEQASRIVREARTAGGGTGHTGCVARVVFRMPAFGEEPPRDE